MVVCLPLTPELAVLAPIVPALLAIPLGVVAAVRQDTWVAVRRRVVLQHIVPNVLARSSSS